MIINKEFYNRSAVDVAKDLLGKVLVREVDGKILKGKIVETEAYIGESDKACHAYNGRRTKRTEPLYGEGGISYIYFIYNLYSFKFLSIKYAKHNLDGPLAKFLI